MKQVICRVVYVTSDGKEYDNKDDADFSQDYINAKEALDNSFKERAKALDEEKSRKFYGDK